MLGSTATSLGSERWWSSAQRPPVTPHTWNVLNALNEYPCRDQRGESTVCARRRRLCKFESKIASLTSECGEPQLIILGVLALSQ